MKKFLYIAPVCINLKKPDGVAKKVLNHFTIFDSYYESTLIAYGTEGIFELSDHEKQCIYPINGHRRFALFEYIKNKIKISHYDYVYIRYPKCDLFFIKLLKAIKKTTAKIVVEIPTYPYNGNKFENFKIAVIAFLDAYFRKFMKKYVDRIVTFSRDRYIFNIPTICTINGIIFDKVKMRSKYYKNDDKITLIAVATIYECHGYDRIIEGLHDYYLNGGKINIIFHIVGTGPAVPGYKLLIDKYNLNNHVLLEGYRTGKELDDLYDDSDIAVNSIAIHRLKLKEESTLKTKEYAAKGLPMISSYFVDAFDESGNQKYVLRVPSDDSAVEINEIINFYNKLYCNKSSAELASTIRKVSKNICDMETTLLQIFNFFKAEKE